MSLRPPTRSIAALFVASVLSTVLCLTLPGTLSWAAGLLALAAPIQAERILITWRHGIALTVVTDA